MTGASSQGIRQLGVGFIFAVAIGAALVVPARAQQQSCTDPANRQPGQWCTGDVFLGVGNLVDYPVLDPRTGQPTYDKRTGDEITTSVNKAPGTYMMIDANGINQTTKVVDAV